MRLNEICQLYKNDIQEIDGIWCFDINENDAKKRIKSMSGIRKIPIHPILLDLGFINYVNTIKPQHIWKNLIYNEKNGYGNRFQKWFQRINRKEITKDKRKSFHSFRHTVTDNLKQCGIDVHIIAEIIGHSTDSITMERYGKSFQPKIMLETLQKLDYGFDIIVELKKIKNS